MPKARNLPTRLAYHPLRLRPEEEVSQLRSEVAAQRKTIEELKNDFVVSPVKDEEQRCRVCLAWKWTKSWIGEPGHPSARGLARRDFLDCRPQLIVRECSGVVQGDLAGAIEQH